MSDQNVNSTPDSDKLAGRLYSRYFETDKATKARNIVVIGGWGTGKSTVKKRLSDEIKDKNKDIFLVDFNAMQFEEYSQVTSQFYSTIADEFKNKKTKLKSSKFKNDFNAIAYLKKETNSDNLSVGLIIQVIVIGLITFLITKLSKVEWINNALSSIPCLFPVSDPALGNKLILLAILIGLIFWKRKYLLKFIAAKIPKLSHVEILQKIQLEGRELVIMVDELDRLSLDSTKYLLDEILILKDSLNFNDNNKCSIFVFCDVNTLQIKDNAATTAKYLQKHFNYHEWIFPPSQLETVKRHIEKNYLLDNLDSREYDLTPFYAWIADSFTSFRDIEKLLDQLQKVTQISKIEASINSYNNSKYKTGIIEYCFKSDTSDSNKVRTIFKILAIYSNVDYEIYHLKENKGKHELKLIHDIREILLQLLCGVRDDMVFVNLKKYREEIKSELDIIKQELIRIQEENTTILSIYTALHGFSLPANPSSENHTKKHRQIDEKINNIKNKELQEEVRTIYQSLKTIKHKIAYLNDLNKARNDQYKLLEKNKNLLETSIQILDDRQNNGFISTDDKIKESKNYLNLNGFREDFHPIAKAIIEDIKCYEEIFMGSTNIQNISRIIDDLLTFVSRCILTHSAEERREDIVS